MKMGTPETIFAAIGRRAMLTLLACLLLACLPLVTTAAATAAAAGAGGDLILLNGKIITMDAHDTVAQAMAIHDGRITAVGTNELVSAHRTPATRVIDLHGRTVTPGLIDSHAHIAEGGVAKLYSVDLGDVTTIADVRKRLSAQVASLKPGEWLLGQGWDEGKLTEHRYITAADLDDIAPANPIWLEHTTGHYGVANSRALKLAGIDSSPRQVTAGTIDRNAAGQPSGVLKEGAMALVTDHIPATTHEQERAGIRASIDEMHREGMTAVKDPAITASQWDAYDSLDREGKLGAHVCVLWRTQPTLEGAQAMLARLEKLRQTARPPQSNLVSCGVKYFMDGSGGGRTAWMYQDWNKNSHDTDTGNRGYPLIEPEVYRQSVRLFHAAGIHVATHAIGDRAIDWVVDTYAQVLKEKPTKGLRHAIIHANTPTDHALAVMAQLQRDYDAGFPETQAPFAWWIGDNYAGNLGPKRALRLNPYHTYGERGIRWGGGSDYPVTPLPARYGIWASVARTTVHGVYGAQPFGTAESVDVGTALKSYTIWAAHQLFIDTQTGSLETGKSADLAVWDRDLMTVPTADLKDMKCELTVFRGRVVYEPRSRRPN